jgi:TolB-like protein/Tfp pilus assembly protein PilF
LVVLPLTNFSRDPEQEYFADAMTEALIADLAKVGALRIISRTSAMRYKGTGKSLPEIAEELGVDGVVEGSVLRAGSRVRITAQLIHAATDTHLWAENYERDLQDVLILQSEVAHAIAKEINIAITGEDKKRLETARRINPEAHEAYLKGRFHFCKLSREHLDTAEEYYQLALEKDPNYALAYAGIASVWAARGDTGLVPPSQAYPRIISAATKALALDDQLADVHVTMGNCTFCYQWDWGSTETEYRRAIQLNPNYADAHFFYADFLMSMERLDEAAAEMDRVLKLDPFNFFFQAFYGWHLIYLRRYDDALAQLCKTIKFEPDFPAAHMGLWGAFYMKGMYEEALAEAKAFFILLRDTEIVEALAAGCGEAGYKEAMRSAAEKMSARPTHVPGVRIARLFAHAGDHDRALSWLEKAYDNHETPLVHLPVAWDWDGLRSDARFQNLLRLMNLPKLHMGSAVEASFRHSCDLERPGS